jgi:hypothetical protein
MFGFKGAVENLVATASPPLRMGKDMQKQEYGNRHIEVRSANTADDGKLVAPQGSPSRGTVLRLFGSTTTERPPLPAKGSKRPPITETFSGAVEAARAKARQIINEQSGTGYTRIVEGWQQLPDGNIQFTIRTLLR